MTYTRKETGPIPTRKDSGTHNTHSGRGPRIIVNSPFNPPRNPPRNPNNHNTQYKHDPLCLLIMTAQGPVVRTAIDNIRNCWCMCPSCWDKQAQRCICRYCPCPSSSRYLGGTILGFSTKSANHMNSRNPA